ncbi:hypothetical protein F5I97DRAFT_1015914 [Phlebopus sp. FC_14]|nr:hypothetical protein F5I97DRAFT_1015914 [Phlebopus sp. FC_14]
MHKRKHRRSPPRAETHELDSALYIQAHEADIIRGPQAASFALALKYPQDSGTRSNDGPKVGSGLVRWGPPDVPAQFDETRHDTESQRSQLWVDRYDVRLLLDTLPERSAGVSRAIRPLSPSGWSDLPSDSEDTFFFSPDELDSYRRDKRRRLLERGREERLRAIAAEEGDKEVDSDPWGGSDEEPDEKQQELLRRTASHIILSPNPAQLEMRILANYGADKRFAFLRGRWPRAWRREKERARQQKDAEGAKHVSESTPLGGLAGYGDSDDSHEEEERHEETVERIGVMSGLQTEHEQVSIDDARKEARRARAREWAAQRRAEQASRSEPE